MTCCQCRWWRRLGNTDSAFDLGQCKVENALTRDAHSCESWTSKEEG